MNKFIIKIKGGLGNQLFQYAFIKALSKRTGIDYLLDFSSYTIDYCRKPILLKLKIDDKIAKTNDLIGYTDIRIIKKVPKLIRILLNKEKYITKTIKATKSTLTEEVFNQYFFDKYFFNLTEPCYIDGFFQNEKYFKEIKKDLLNDFLPKKGFSKKFLEFQKEIQKCQNDSVSLHIRRGDYVNNKVFGNCTPLKYYEKALNIIKKKIKFPVIFIFSDDLTWVRNNLQTNIKRVFVNCSNEETPYEDMWLMAECKHNIIANSSFSWWGAWLNQNDKKIVIAPKKWSSLRYINTTDVVPNEWLQI